MFLEPVPTSAPLRTYSIRRSPGHDKPFYVRSFGCRANGTEVRVYGIRIVSFESDVGGWLRKEPFKCGNVLLGEGGGIVPDLLSGQ